MRENRPPRVLPILTHHSQAIIPEPQVQVSSGADTTLRIPTEPPALLRRPTSLPMAEDGPMTVSHSQGCWTLSTIPTAPPATD